MAEGIKTIEVRAGNASYNYSVGNRVLDINSLVASLKKIDRIGIIISKRVFDLHREYIEGSFPQTLPFDVFIMEDDEENKSYLYAEGFLQKMVKNGFSRNSLLLGIGGGVVGDFTGFLASVYMRGVSVLHVPTTLLSMVDSSIGGKVAVNLSVGKNIVGAFHQPMGVLSDVSFLETLPEKEWLNGLTEIIKHGLIGDEETLSLLDSISKENVTDKNIIIDIIRASAAFKASIVEKDEKEGGIRAILNFGHTVAHALESILEFTGISHGEAVAAGMIVETEMSKRIGLLPEEDAERIINLMHKFLPSQYCYELSGTDLIEHMKYDKKNKDGKINFVLLEGVGLPVIDKNVDDNCILEALKLILK